MRAVVAVVGVVSGVVVILGGDSRDRLGEQQPARGLVVVGAIVLAICLSTVVGHRDGEDG